MPWQSEWVSAPLFFEHRGVQVFCTYKHDEMNTNPPYGYSFVLDAEGTIEEAFDVRQLKSWFEDPARPPFLDKAETDTPENRAAWKRYHEEEMESVHVKEVLRRAIESGELKALQDEA